MERRQFVNTLAGIGIASLAPLPSWEADQRSSRIKVETKLETFEYKGVRLLPGMFSRQVENAREVYFGMPNDDILKGFRRAAGQVAPGNDMTGWAAKTSSSTFGQWLSGMSRMSAALDDSLLQEKAITLGEGWGKTIGSDGNPRMGHYAWDKLACGMVDLHMYAAWEPALPLLERTLGSVAQSFDRSRSPATEKDRSGRLPKNTGEWYTLSENLYRAYVASGNPAFREFADVWRYEHYWNGFETSPPHPPSYFLHAYSHVNTFSGAAMTYAVTGDKRYLRIIQNAYDFVRGTQCYASGGYGPGEWSVPPDGTLGTSLEIRTDHAEIPCGSWAGFKLSRYLMSFTGEARYGDWIETLLYNGIGAALPVQPDGRTFYYADYRLGTGTKLYFWDTWPCCSGTYIQTVADYHNVIYLKNPSGLFVNLYIPSEVSWKHGGESVTVRQETTFPESETSTFRIDLEKPVRLALNFRIPSWSNGFSVAVNGQSVPLSAKAGEWATVDRTWSPRDQVTVTIPLELRLVRIDAQHPRRAAVMYGPVLLAQEARFTMPLSLKTDERVSELLVRDGDALKFKAVDRTPPALRGVNHSLPGEVGAFQPFYNFPERRPYRVYFDLDKPRFI